MENAAPTPIQAAPAVQSFTAMLAAGAPDPVLVEEIITALENERSLEYAWLILRQAHPDPARWGALQAWMKRELERSRPRRMSLWQADPERTTLRLRFSVGAPASAQHPAGLLALLARALMEAGLPVAVGLEKALRPAVHLGHPLPPLVEGRSEWADAVLQRPVSAAPAELPALINRHAPGGLAVLECLQVPNHASPVAELCRTAHWRWACPEPLLEAARARMERFIGSERFEVEKTGKIGGQKGAKRVDIRPLLEDCRWSGADLLFRTRLAPGEAANPRKLLAAILGTEVQDLVRLSVELDEDPRLLQADRFQPKLHNMYEDAVPLCAQGNIRIVEEDDDEPTRLG